VVVGRLIPAGTGLAYHQARKEKADAKLSKLTSTSKEVDTDAFNLSDTPEKKDFSRFDEAFAQEFNQDSQSE